MIKPKLEAYIVCSGSCSSDIQFEAVFLDEKDADEYARNANVRNGVPDEKAGQMGINSHTVESLPLNPKTP